MADPWHHAVSSTKKWGGTPEQYLDIHRWFDETKSLMSDFRHRALRHHSEGIEMAVRLFGQVLAVDLGVRCQRCAGRSSTADSDRGRWHEPHCPGYGDPESPLAKQRQRLVPVRWVGEQHVREDMGGRIPSAVDWLRALAPEPWMNRPLRLSEQLENHNA